MRKVNQSKVSIGTIKSHIQIHIRTVTTILALDNDKIKL